MNITAISKLIMIANAEVGYLEKSAWAYKSNPDIIYQNTAGAGHDNYTKYNYEMHKIYPAVMDFPAPWCDAFVDWCFYKAFGLTTAKSLLGGNFDDYTVASAGMFQKFNALDSNPRVGDQVFFTKNGAASGSYHTGIVYEISGGYIKTIEGNTNAGTAIVDNGGSVARKAYPMSYCGNKLIFGHPNYDLIKNETPKPTTITKPKYEINKKYETTKALTIYNGSNGVSYKHSELNDNLKGKDKNKDGKLDKGSKVTCYKKEVLKNGNVWIKIAPKAEYWVLAYKKAENQINLK